MKLSMSSLNSSPNLNSCTTDSPANNLRVGVPPVKIGAFTLKLCLYSLFKGLRLSSLNSPSISFATLSFSELPESLPLSSSEERYSIFFLTFEGLKL